MYYCSISDCLYNNKSLTKIKNTLLWKLGIFASCCVSQWPGVYWSLKWGQIWNFEKIRKSEIDWEN